jgi:hypothetical protein
MRLPAFIHLLASVYDATRCSIDFYAYEVVRGLLPRLYGRTMQDPASELRRTLFPRTSVNKSLLVCLLALPGRFGTQPERDVSRLHRLPHHPHQVVVQRVEVGLVPELGGEGF